MSEQLTEYQKNLVETHVWLAQSLANKFWSKLPGVLDYDDVVSAAYHGLVTAAKRFDTTLRPGEDPNYDPFLAFGSFARIRITGSIQDLMRSMDHVSKNQRRLYKDLRKLGDDLSAAEKAEILGIDVDKIRAVTAAVEVPPISLEKVMRNSSEYARDDSETWAMAAEPHSPDDTESSYLANEVQLAVVTLLQELPEFERSVIVLRYYLGYDFSRIAAELGLTMSRVSAIHQETVALLHSAMCRVVDP